MNKGERTLEFWIWYFIYYLLINSIWIENVILNSICHEYFLPKQQQQQYILSFPFAICNCINDVLIISSWYLIDRKLLSWSSKIRKCYKVQGFLPFARIGRIRMRFVHFVLEKIQFLSAFRFTFGCSSNYLSILHCIYSSGNPLLDMGLFECVLQTKYLCHLWFAITVIFWIFAQTFIDKKSVWYSRCLNGCNPQMEHTQKYTFYHCRLDEKNRKIISLSQPHRSPCWMYYVHLERRWECITKRKIASDVYVFVMPPPPSLMWFRMLKGINAMSFAMPRHSIYASRYIYWR